MKHLPVALSLLFCSATAMADDCLAPEALKRLDGQYEDALRVGDPDFMQSLLAEDFVWVHNHAVATEDKATLIGRLDDEHEEPMARRSEQVQHRRLNNTAVLSGFTTVEKAPREVGGEVRGNKYHFMRTYVIVGSRCYLLANQTMKVWSSEEVVN